MSAPTEDLDLHREAKRRLMREAGQLRSRLYPLASDEAWRRERLYRYLYWREHREHAPSNLVGAWEVPDLEREIARWNDYARRELDEDAVLELLDRDLSEHYGKAWEVAVEEGTSPLLAAVHMPIWHAATGSLIPQALGHLRIFSAEQYDDAQLGWTFTYGCEETGQKLSLILYNGGLDGIAAGVEDPRLEAHFHSSCHDMIRFAQANEASVVDGSATGPVVETLTDTAGREAPFVGLYLEVLAKDATMRAEAISMCGFRGHWLKVRYTCAPFVEGGSHPGLEEINAGIADYVAHFR